MLPKRRSAGFISARHGPAWLASADAELVAVCDQDVTKAQARAAEWGIAAVYAPKSNFKVFWALILAEPDEKRG